MITQEELEHLHILRINLDKTRKKIFDRVKDGEEIEFGSRTVKSYKDQTINWRQAFIDVCIEFGLNYKFKVLEMKEQIVPKIRYTISENNKYNLDK